jgi:DNA-binding response OmpR family regulator
MSKTVSIRARRTPFKHRKLLVIDDDTKLLASYRDLLSPYGFEILTATDGREAVPLVEKNPDIQLVILDLAMPRMDGREWLRWFRTLRTELPVIVITAYKLDPNDSELNPAVVLEKPFHVAELLDLVGLFCGLSWPMPVAKV